MAKAFVLVMTETGQEETALDEARKLSTVTGANRVFGAYDMIVRIETDSDNDVGETVRKLRNKEGIRHTVTLNCVEP